MYSYQSRSFILQFMLLETNLWAQVVEAKRRRCWAEGCSESANERICIGK
jgi:hypothetical protein